MTGLANVIRLYREEMGGKQLCVVFGDLTEQGESEITDGALLITTGESRISDALAQRCIVYRVPGTATAFPLFDRSADLVVATGVDDSGVKEALRILRPNGKLIAPNSCE